MPLHHFTSKHIVFSKMENQPQRLRFPCERCEANFATKYNLNRHVRVKHGGDMHLCQDCGTTFTRLESLMRHREILHRTQPDQPANPAFRAEPRPDSSVAPNPALPAQGQDATIPGTYILFTASLN